MKIWLFVTGIIPALFSFVLTASWVTPTETIYVPKVLLGLGIVLLGFMAGFSTFCAVTGAVALLVAACRYFIVGEFDISCMIYSEVLHGAALGFTILACFAALCFGVGHVAVAIF